VDRIVFLDFDGVMIPERAYWIEGQTRPVTKFDPVAVSLINRLCKKASAKVVIVSSWRRTTLASIPEDLKKHLITEGIKEEHIHEDHSCPFKFSSNKYSDVSFWLEEHPWVKEYIIIDDDLNNEVGSSHQGRIIDPDFLEGFIYKHYLRAEGLFGFKETSLFI
jgi:hypothetical protein